MKQKIRCTYAKKYHKIGRCLMCGFGYKEIEWDTFQPVVKKKKMKPLLKYISPFEVSVDGYPPDPEKLLRLARAITKSEEFFEQSKPPTKKSPRKLGY